MRTFYPLFGWLSPDIIKQKFQHTTQYACLPTGAMFWCAFKSPYPALNVMPPNEAIACHIVYSDVPAVNDGSTADIQVTDIYGIKMIKSLTTHLKTK
jgi:hypothetical protein